MNYLFDFNCFISSLRNKPEKRSTIEEYESYYGIMPEKIEETQFYIEYLSKFEIPDEIIEHLQLPEELVENFDWKLLCKLILSSLSSECYFTLPNEDNKVDLIIKVRSGDSVVIKSLSELWSFQILRLYEIYVEENINLCKLKAEDERERDAISCVQDKKLSLAKDKIINLKLNFEESDLLGEILK